MLTYTNPITKRPVALIGIDPGNGYIKTVNTCFRAGVAPYDKDTAYNGSSLQYGGVHYTIGNAHKDYITDKTADQDYYILMLAAVAKELELANLHTVDLCLAVGLPLAFMSEQKDRFCKYLAHEEEIRITYNSTDYHIRLISVEIYPQGFAAVADRLMYFKEPVMICDIGYDTMNILTISGGIPDMQKCFTEMAGVHHCMMMTREHAKQELGFALYDNTIEKVLRYGTLDIDERYLTVIRASACEYVSGMMRRLEKYAIRLKTNHLYVVGGGACLIRHFAECDMTHITIHDDIRINAKGYEFLAGLILKHGETI